MKKKKLKKQIAELKSRLGAEKSRAQAWENISHQFIGELNKCGIKTKIIFPQPPLVDASRMEDVNARYKRGINNEPPTLSFDFTEHDKTVIRTYLRGINLRGINHGKE